MKAVKIALTLVIGLPVLLFMAFFVYTRFVMDQYKMEGDSLTFGESVYTFDDTAPPDDEEQLGKTIGIAVMGERAFTDYVWPFWVMEYQNDPTHERLFVRGLMGSGGTYEKVSP